MGETRRRRRKITERSKTLPSSPTHSSSASSSDFEFTISLSPRTKSNVPADELFYKGKLLPLHLSPRLSMVRTLLLASSSISSSSDTTTTASRDSTGSSTDSHSSFTVADCDSSRPSSVTEDDELKRLNTNLQYPGSNLAHQIKKSKYFSLSRFSSVFRKNSGKESDQNNSSSGMGNNKRMNSSAKDVFRKYLKKVKPLYEKLSSQKQQQQQQHHHHHQRSNEISPIPTSVSTTISSVLAKSDRSEKQTSSNKNVSISHSFSGNLRYPRKRNCVSSCPSSMRSSPNHSGVLTKTGVLSSTNGYNNSNNRDSSMEELQSAIQGAIAHCKNSMLNQNTSKSIGSCSKDV